VKKFTDNRRRTPSDGNSSPGPKNNIITWYIKGLSNSQNSSFSYRLQGSHAVEIICATWADYNNDFVHLKPKFNNEVVEAGQKRVLMEFLRSLFTK
jgi:hypothetical protein